MSGDTTPPHPSPLPKGARGLVCARRKVVSQLDVVCVDAADVQACLTPFRTTDDPRCVQLNRQVANNRDRRRVQPKPEVRMTAMIQRAQSSPLSSLGRGLG